VPLGIQRKGAFERGVSRYESIVFRINVRIRHFARSQYCYIPIVFFQVSAERKRPQHPSASLDRWKMKRNEKQVATHEFNRKRFLTIRANSNTPDNSASNSISLMFDPSRKRQSACR
jgi:hypothetical protein